MELKDTIELMTSADYKKRFRAEYEQTRIRYEKLGEMLFKHRCGRLEFKPTCPIRLLELQHEAMRQYLNILEVRAEIEGIDLSGRCCETWKYYNERKDFLFRCEAAHSDTQTLDCYQPKEQEKQEDGDKPDCLVALVPRKTK